MKEIDRRRVVELRSRGLSWARVAADLSLPAMAVYRAVTGKKPPGAPRASRPCKIHGPKPKGRCRLCRLAYRRGWGKRWRRTERGKATVAAYLARPEVKVRRAANHKRWVVTHPECERRWAGDVLGSKLVWRDSAGEIHTESAPKFAPRKQFDVVLAVRLREKGKPWTQIAAAVGVHRKTAIRWVQRFQPETIPGHDAVL